MPAHISPCPHPTAPVRPSLPAHLQPPQFSPTLLNQRRGVASSSNGFRVRVSSGESYLDMWKKAIERERKTDDFQRVLDNGSGASGDNEDGASGDLERKTEEFKRILEVPKEERDRVQRMQVIDRASAAIAAAHALLNDTPPQEKASPIGLNSSSLGVSGRQDNAAVEQGLRVQGGKSAVSNSETPGPDFWTWSPPPDGSGNIESSNHLQPILKPALSPDPVSPVMEKENSASFLSIPFESNLLKGDHNPPLPPLQSLMEFEKVGTPQSDQHSFEEELKHELLFSKNAAEAVDALHKSEPLSSQGVYPDGSKWWKETGIEQRPNGIVCKWTVTRGVSADKGVEWEEKYWEAADPYDYKELGSEKVGRDASGNVWREFWKESMWQDLKSGLMHIEKTADKWGKNGNGGEWQEKWWEHYNAVGEAEKWAHKWCCIDPNTPLELGHAHVWHERWGEKYDGQGSSIKYTDKWAERSDGDAWTKWGDKWDEHFGSNGHGVKQGETWWEGKHGERWSRTWGEQHNGSGWVHKYGKSSCGEHWDTHVEQETWYEKYPHFGFEHCFENSVQLREVQKPSETS